MAESPEKLEEHMKILTDTLEGLGFILNLKKWVKVPQRVMELLGFMVNATQTILSHTVTAQSGGPGIYQPLVSITIVSDASRGGWGAVCRSTSTGGPWTRAESRENISFLECF